MLTDEQAQNIKTHLLEQLENFPEEQRKIIKHKILSMNNSEMEEFLKENNLQESKETKETPKCIFCSIVKKIIKSYIITENEEYVAILELNPLTRGHTLIIPKKHYSVDKLPESSIEFAKKISSIFFNKLKPKDVQFQKNEVLGHGNLEVIPIYGEEKLEKHRATEEELKELHELLRIEESKPTTKETRDESHPADERLPKEEIKTPETPKEELPKIKPRLKWI